MSLLPGSQLGPYEVTAQIGAGGMGEVYRARDTRLKRDVALKILPESFASDPDRLARFQREAEVLASLNHPHIAAIYGLEDVPSTGSGQAGTQALVMELVEGPTLADRIAKGPIPVDEALAIATQIAEALEAAHEQGIIHRDLKPANIKVRPDGTVKVLDFGLAKAMEVVGSPGPKDPAYGLSISPTLTSPAMMTGVGMILGTAAYMSPEQARGKNVDKRADIWAFGAVLFEMLTGRRAFEDEDVSMTLSKVLQREPDYDALPSSVPARVRQVLRVCLRKDPKQRAGDIRDVRLALEGAFESPALPLVPSATTPARRQPLPWIAALAVAAILMAAMAIPTLRHLRETSPPAPPETRADISTAPTSDPSSFALSPDARQIVFVGSGDGFSRRLWLRPLADTLAQPLAGTDNALYPFWSPDSKSIAFFAEGKLKRVDIGGGRPLAIADAAAGRGGTWNAEGVILFAASNVGPLFRVPASGGAVVAATKLDRQSSHHVPVFLPDGRQFLFAAGGTPDAAGTYLGSLDSAEIHRLMPSETSRVGYVESGWALSVRDGALVAQRLDMEAKALTGDPVTLADAVALDSAGVGALSVSAGGLVAYRTGGANIRRQLAWFDRSGKSLGVLGAEQEGSLIAPSLSPDGRRAVVQRTAQGNTDIWILDGARTSRLTFDPGNDQYPIWSPDGSRIVFDSSRKGHRDLYQKTANGAGTEEVLLESEQDKTAGAWSPDGRFLLYRSSDPPRIVSDLWVLPLDGDRKPFAFVSTPFDERTGQFSSDGRWVAYQSSESGRFEIYVRPFPGPGGQWQVSTSGGSQVRWRRDGKELYYIAPDGTLMAAGVAVSGDSFQPGVPVALFQTRIWGGGNNTNNRQQYDVAADGRFLINVPVGDESTSPITLLTNWAPPPK